MAMASVAIISKAGVSAPTVRARPALRAAVGLPGFSRALAPVAVARAPRAAARSSRALGIVTKASVESHNELHPGAKERDESKYVYYEVKEGEYLMKIGTKFDMTWEELNDSNKDSVTTEDHMIWPGEVLRIPKKKYVAAVAAGREAGGAVSYKVPAFIGGTLLALLLAALLAKLRKSEPEEEVVERAYVAPPPPAPKAQPPPPKPKTLNELPLADIKAKLPGLTALEILGLPLSILVALAPMLSGFQLESIAARLSKEQLEGILPHLSIDQLAVLLPLLSPSMLAVALAMLSPNQLNALMPKIGAELCKINPKAVEATLPKLDAPTQLYLIPLLGLKAGTCDQIKAMSNAQIMSVCPSFTVSELMDVAGCFSPGQLKVLLPLLSDDKIKALIPTLSIAAVEESFPSLTDAQLGFALPLLSGPQMDAYLKCYSARAGGIAAAAPSFTTGAVTAMVPKLPDHTAAAALPKMAVGALLAAAPLVSAAAAKAVVGAVDEPVQKKVVPVLMAKQLDLVLPGCSVPVLETSKTALTPKLSSVAPTTIAALTMAQKKALGLWREAAPAAPVNLEGSSALGLPAPLFWAAIIAMIAIPSGIMGIMDK